MRSRMKTGSVVQDKRDKVWHFYWWDNGKRHSKTLGRFKTKSEAWSAAKQMRIQLESGTEKGNQFGPTIFNVVTRYRAERMPTRSDTKRTYETWLNNHILPRWGEHSLADLKPRSVELWLASLPLAPKSMVHIRGLLRTLWDFAAWAGDVPLEQRNPIELVRIKGTSKRVHAPRSLTTQEFHHFSDCLSEPFRTMALLCCCLGLRISECLALRWCDVDWVNCKLRVERAIVAQKVEDVKTSVSRKNLVVAEELLGRLHGLRQTSQFGGPDDWIFASPVQIGRFPWSYDQVFRTYRSAARAAGLGSFGTHTMRHTFRTWLDSLGTPIGVQQKMMRHADIRTTMNIYGDAVTADMAEAHYKIVRLALPS